MEEIKDTTKAVATDTKSEEKSGLPKGTERFGAVIKAYLDKRAGEDELFRTKYKAVNRPIEDIIAYIIAEVHKSGQCGWTDDEVYSLAIHAAEVVNLFLNIDWNIKPYIPTHSDGNITLHTEYLDCRIIS